MRRNWAGICQTACEHKSALPKRTANNLSLRNIGGWPAPSIDQHRIRPWIPLSTHLGTKGMNLKAYSLRSLSSWLRRFQIIRNGLPGVSVPTGGSTSHWYKTIFLNHFLILHCFGSARNQNHGANQDAMCQRGINRSLLSVIAIPDFTGSSSITAPSLIHALCCLSEII